MSVKATRLPPMTTVLGAIDLEGRNTARAASKIGLAAVRQTMPARSGRARRSQRASVRRETTGYVIEISPNTRERYPSGVSGREVTRFVDQGTGIYGPRGRPIRPRKAKAFHLPSGWHSGTIQGQHAQHVYDRAFSSSDAQVARTLALGAVAAARAAERALAGGIR